MKGRLVEYDQKADEYLVGDFWFFGENRGYGLLRLGYRCPHCGDLRQIPLESKDGSAKWNWDGNKEAPTITPSIRHVPAIAGQCDWHGYLTKGEWVTVSV